MVVPALDAAQTVGAVVRGVYEACPGAQVWVVDDGSRDGTADAAAEVGAVVVRHDTNLGKGRALAAGVAQALAWGAEAIVTLDADGQHPPHEIPRILAPLAGDADLAVGARPRTAGVMPLPRRVTNAASSWALGIALGRPVLDAQSGFRAFRRRVAEAIRPDGARYEFETEFLYLAASRGFRIAWVPVPVVYHDGPSHFRPVTDAARILGLYLRLGGRWLARRA